MVATGEMIGLKITPILLPQQIFTSYVTLDHRTAASVFHVGPDVPSPAIEVVENELLPLIASGPHVGFRASPAEAGTWAIPLACSSDNVVMAAVTKDAGGPPVWLLPPPVEDPVPWVRAAYATWSETDPVRFPPHPDWRYQIEWQTIGEAAEQRALDQLRTDFDTTESIFRATEASTQARLLEARSAADRTVRRLLTHQGPELEEAVVSALRHIGFTVEVMDSPERRGDLLEDVRVTDPDDPPWLALVEIRGHKRGAQLADITKIGRFVRRYLKATSKEPTRVWLVVNAFFGQDPSTRDQPLRSNPDEVEAFATADNGAIIDTRLLFRIVQQINDPDELRRIRKRLREAVGRVEASLLFAP
jgi:hypothetical protein